MNNEKNCCMENICFDYNGFQVVRGEFLSRTNIPAILFDGVKVSVNTACLQKMPDVDHIQFLVNPAEQKLVLRPCESEDKDSFRWCNEKDNKRIPRKIICRLFSVKLAELMGWEPERKYRILGTLIKANSEYLMLFDLNEARFLNISTDCDKKTSKETSFFPNDWREQFGISAEEHGMLKKINLFDDYTVISLNRQGKEDEKQ